MERAILGHPVTTNSRSFVFALAPAAIAVVILASQIQQSRSDKEPINASSDSESTLSKLAPISSAEAHAPAERTVDLLSTTEPATAGALSSGLTLEIPLYSDQPPPEAPNNNIESTLELPSDSATNPEKNALRTQAKAPHAEHGASEILKVRRGDSLSSLLSGAGIVAADWLAVSRLQGDARALHRLQPGDTLEIRRDKNSLLELKLPLNKMRTLVVARDANGFQQRVAERVVEYRRAQREATIQSSMYLAALEVGISDRMIMEFAEIFAWDIDFSRDVREGDLMRVIFDEPFDLETGEQVGNARIIAAEYIQANSRKFEAIHYEPKDGFAGYFNADGRPLRKAFLRTPVEFARISSRFSRARKHPVLNKVRAHKGVDYAAQHGTPIRATGSGRVAFAGRKGGYGRTVIIKHNGQYKTLYAHMSRYVKGLRSGDRVKQGDIIGYVGSSGLATGPHLHYEFHKNGRHTDPLSVKLPAADPLPQQEMARFREHSNPLLKALAQISDNSQVARAEVSSL